MRETHINFVRDVLSRQGFISRNYCIKLPAKDRIVNLAAVIHELATNEGYEFVTKTKRIKGSKKLSVRYGQKEGHDYVYSLTNEFFNILQ